MRVTTDIEYPGSSPGKVFELLVDREFRAAVCEATRALRYDVDVGQPDDSGAVSVRVARTLPADVPDVVKRFVGRTITIVQSERWGPPSSDGGRRADLVIEIVGQPAKMSGTVSLQAVGDGARERISGDLRVSVPFVAKKIESEVAKAIVAAAAKEQETGRVWLAGAR